MKYNSSNLFLEGINKGGEFFLTLASKEIHFLGLTMELEDSDGPPDELLEKPQQETVIFEAPKILIPKMIEPEHQQYSAEFI